MVVVSIVKVTGDLNTHSAIAEYKRRIDQKIKNGNEKVSRRVR